MTPTTPPLVQLEEIAGAGQRSWHLLMPEGVFQHPRYGKLDFRQSFFEQIKKNFDDRVRHIDIFIDTHHENKDAAGWLKALEYRDGQGLFGEIEWTPLGVEKVSKNLLRYFSAEFGPYRDELTGIEHENVLAAVTLTNVPYLKRQPGLEMRFSDLFALAEDSEAYPDVPAEDFAGPHRSFPIRNQNDVKDAWNLRGHADDPEAVGRKIVAIAKRKGLKPPAAATQQHEDTVADTTALEDVCSTCHKVESECECVENCEGCPKMGSACSDCEMLGEMTTADTQAAATVAQGNTTPKPKKKVKKPAGNEGAPQPGQMRGPKPHITRGRQPNPGNEVQHMSEETQTMADTVSLDEFKAVTARMDQQNKKLEEALTAANDRLALAEKRELERDITDEVRRLSEARAAADGSAALYGIPAAVTELYRTFALSTARETRESVFAMLAELQKVGTVKLAESGVAHTGMARDPESDTKLSEEDRIQRRAEELARADSKTLSDLEAGDMMRYMFRAEKEIRG